MSFSTFAKSLLFKNLSKPSERWTFGLIVAATTVAGITVVYSISQSKQSSETTLAVKTFPKMRQVTALGRLQPVTEVIKVSVPETLSNDRVAQLLVERGDQVALGQVIAIMSAKSRLQDALLEAEAQVKVSQAEMAKVKAGAKLGEIVAQKAEIVRLKQQQKGEIATQQATIARWEAEVKNADADYSRYFLLYEQKVISSAQLDQKRLTLETAQAQLKEAKARQNQTIDTLEEQIRQAKATLNKVAEVRPVDVLSARASVDKAIASVKKAKSELAEVYIRAPIAGRILEIYTKPGEVVDSKGIANLGQTNKMAVVAEVYETDIGKIRKGQQAIITSDSFPGELHGTVRLIGLQVTQQEVTSGKPGENLDRKVIKVRIQLNPKDSQKVASLTDLQVQVAIKPYQLLSNTQ